MQESVWLPHKVHVYTPAQPSPGDGRIFITHDGEQVRIDSWKVVNELARVHPAQLEGVEDVCTLPAVSEGALLHTVRTRFERGDVYTRVSRILLAVNPFQSLPLYSAKYLEKYQKAGEAALPPHVFGIGQDALNGLRFGTRDQAVLITGESGAGKTESTKLILSFVASAMKGGGEEVGVEERLLRTNPVVEAFGNAMTVRNSNSSRFGKWFDLQFSTSIRLLGCSLTSYLLETTRVCTQASDERNYHIFFMLLRSRDAPAVAPLKLEPEVEHYAYLKGGRPVAPGVDDVACFGELLEAFAALGFDAPQQSEIFRIVAGILFIGNCSFAEPAGDGIAALVSEAPAQRAAELLGIPVKELTSCMLVRRITVAGDVTETPLNAAKAQGARDAMSRKIYGRLFGWLCDCMNKVMAGPAGAEAAEPRRLLGVLDIAGFECFEQNNLEQLLINLSNEHLQQQFCTSVFKAELEDCSHEGIELPGGNLEYPDNSDVLALLDGRGGILEIMDEEISVPKATDQTFVQKVCRAHEKHKRFSMPRFRDNPMFGLRHYAGEVTYTLTGVLEKNADKPPDGLMEMLQGSSLASLRAATRGDEPEETNTPQSFVGNKASARGGAKAKMGPKKQSVASSFRTSLRSLLTKISATDPHYVRCLKPNKERKPGIFTGTMVFEQMQISGVLEAVKIRQIGFAARVPFTEFVVRYGCIMADARRTAAREGRQPPPKATPTEDAEGAKLVITTVPRSLFPKESSGVTFGKTKVFMNSQALAVMEAERLRVLGGAAAAIQRLARGRRCRRRASAMRKAREGLRAWLQTASVFEPSQRAAAAPAARGNNKRLTVSDVSVGAVRRLGSAAAVEQAVAQAAPLLAEARRVDLGGAVVMEAEKTRQRMQLELDCVKRLVAVSTSVDPLEVEMVLTRARDLSLAGTAEAVPIEERVGKLKEQVPLIQALRRTAEEGLNAQLGKDILLAKARLQDPTASAANVQAPKGNVSQAQVREVLDKVQAAGLRAAPDKWVPELGGPALVEAVLKMVVEEKKEVAPPQEAPKAAREEPESWERLRGDLKQAADILDAAALGRLLGEASREELPKQDVEPARGLFEKLNTEAFLVSALADARREADVENPEADVLRRLQNLLQQMKKLNLDEGVLKPSMTVMQDAARKRNRGVIKRSTTKTLGRDDKRLNVLIFGDFSTFKGLKQTYVTPPPPPPPPPPAGGSRSSASVPPPPSTGILFHTEEAISEALTVVPPAMEARAVQNFKDVLVAMHDWVAQDCQRESSRQAILDLGRSEPKMRNEIYVQVMKQMNSNLSEESVLAGWRLLQGLCQQSPPGEDFFEFVRAFAGSAGCGTRASSGYMEEAASLAKSCLRALQTAEAGGGEAPQNEEDRTESDGEQPQPRRTPTAETAQLPTKSVPLLKFTGDEGNDGAYLAPEGLELIASLPENSLICPVILMGDGRGGKSYLSSRILGVPEAFLSSDSAEPVTEGIDAIVAPVGPILKDAGLPDDSGEPQHMLILDCEGGNNAMAAIRSLVNLFGVLIGTQVVFVASGMASEQALQALGTCLAAKSLCRLGDGDHTLKIEQRLVFVVNKNTLRYTEDAFEQILNAKQKISARAELRTAIQEAFPSRKFCPVPLKGAPEFEECVTAFRRTVLQHRAPLFWGNIPVRRSSLRGLLELVVTEVSKHSDVNMPSVQRYVVFEGFLQPLAEQVFRKTEAELPRCDEYLPDLEERDPVGQALAFFDKGCSHVNSKELVAEARQGLEDRLQAVWQALLQKNYALGDEIVETKMEFREMVVCQDHGVPFGRGLLRDLLITLQTARMEARQAIYRRRGGEPQHGVWEDTGADVSRPAEASLRRFEELPSREGRLLKRNPKPLGAVLSLGTRLLQARICSLRDGLFFWWTPGLPGNDRREGGCINFLLHHAEVLPDERSPTAFIIRPSTAEGEDGELAWQGAMSFTGGPTRVFSFDCSNSCVAGIAGIAGVGERATNLAGPGASEERDAWVADLRVHAEFGRRVCEDLGWSSIYRAIGKEEAWQKLHAEVKRGGD